jgi:predicted amidophosphoribosyltransferase
MARGNWLRGKWLREKCKWQRGFKQKGEMAREKCREGNGRGENDVELLVLSPINSI